MVCVSDLLLVTVQNRNIFPVFKGEKKISSVQNCIYRQQPVEPKSRTKKAYQGMGSWRCL